MQYGFTRNITTAYNNNNNKIKKNITIYLFAILFSKPEKTDPITTTER